MHPQSVSRCLIFGLSVLTLIGCARTESARDSTSADGETIGGDSFGERNEVRTGATDVIELIEGRVAGLQVVRSPSGPRFRIRGTNSFQLSGDALIVLDGLPIGSDGSRLTHLNPNDIDRIVVLKGPDAAMYGLRGSNGVVVITTNQDL